jgi:putative MATE family efflux protein
MSALENPDPPAPAPLVRGPVGKTILGLAVPGMLGVLAMMSTSVLDMYLARFLGTAEQAALQQVFPVTFMLTSLALGLMVGTVSLVARTRGTGDLPAVRRITGQALALSGLVIAFFSVVGFFSYRSLFGLADVPDYVMPKIEEYMGIWFFGTMVMVFPTLGNGVLRACGNAVASSAVLVVTGVLKFALAPMMVLGLFGFPRLALTGAALSNIIAFAGASLLVLWYLKRDDLVTFDGIGTGMTDCWRKILKIGLPSAFTNLLVPISGFIANVLVTPFGTAAVAGFGNALRIESLALVPLFALSGSIGPFLGQNMGAQRTDRMREGFAWSVRFALLYGLAIAVLLFLGGNSFSAVFAATDASILPSKLYLWLVPASFGFYGVLMVVAGAFNGLGNPRPNLILYTGKSLLFAGGIIAGAALDGYRGLCLGIAISNVLAGLAAYLWYRNAVKGWAARPFPD